MKLGERMDYHGSRAYAADLPSGAGASWFEPIARRLAAWTKDKLESLLRPGAEQAAETMWLVRGNEKHFSVLGAELGEERRRAAAPCAFPESEAPISRPPRVG